MKKPMWRKAALNLDFTSMNSKSSSFIPLSTPVISSKLNTVGIRLGKNDSEVSLSANVLRHMEYDRLTVYPKLQNNVENTELDEEALQEIGSIAIIVFVAISAESWQ
jgi:hypothetical protein